MGTASRAVSKKEKCPKRCKEDPNKKQKEKIHPHRGAVVVFAGVLLLPACSPHFLGCRRVRDAKSMDRLQEIPIQKLFIENRMGLLMG